MIQGIERRPDANSPWQSGSSKEDGEPQPTLLLSATDVAKLTGLSLDTVRTYTARGRFEPLRIGHRTFFRLADVHAWIANRKQRSRSARQFTTVILPAGIDPANRLSPREREVLALTLNGATRLEVATRLAICRDTVEVHRKHIRLKLNVSRIADLIARYGAVDREVIHV